MSPGRNRRVPGESGKNLAMEIATQVKNIALIILNLDYPYEKQTINTEQLNICHYIEDIPDQMDYVTIKDGIVRPSSMPKLVGFEP